MVGKGVKGAQLQDLDPLDLSVAQHIPELLIDETCRNDPQWALTLDEILIRLVRPLTKFC